ncbi:MAG: phosphatase PAP2 family protein [Chthoniobacterales bacterium]
MSRSACIAIGGESEPKAAANTITLLIAMSGMYVAAHYFSDVVCAAILGIFCAWLCARWRPPPINRT